MKRNQRKKKQNMIVIDGETRIVKHENIEDYGDKIPLDVASIESCLSLSEWHSLYPRNKFITQKQYVDGQHMILERRAYAIYLKS